LTGTATGLFGLASTTTSVNVLITSHALFCCLLAPS
jgi:hypothetical protein